MLPNDFEISLFGPGVGECAVINLGNDSWVIIDSYVNPVTGHPIAIDYLKEKNVDLGNVKFIFATHWHTDHIKGMSDLLISCVNATFVFSSVFVENEFQEFISGLAAPCSSDSLLDEYLPNATKEFEKISSIIADKKTRKSLLANADSRLFLENKDGCKKEIWTLSPSNQAHFNFLKEISLHHSPSLNGDRVTYIRNVSPNDVCVVVFISVGDYSFVFGADLEESSRMSGWTEIINSTGRPTERSVVFKVPHHGSINGHHEGIWRDLLCEEPICIMTPYSRSRLPRATDVGRLLTKSSHCYITTKYSADSATTRSKNKTTRKKKLSKNVANMVSSECRGFSVVDNGSGGRVTVSIPTPDDDKSALIKGFKLELSEPAGHINSEIH